MANNTGLKFGGRQAGTPNKLTTEMRVILQSVLMPEIESIPDNLNKLEVKDRLEILVKLMPFVLPKLDQAGQQVKFSSVVDTELRDTFLQSLKIGRNDPD